MKIQLNAEQSAKLVKSGINANRASIFTPHPIFTLTDLLALLPKAMMENGVQCKFRITTWYDEPWFAGYENQLGKYITPDNEPFHADELIDALYELVLWVQARILFNKRMI